MRKGDGLVSTPAAADILGVSVSQFMRITTQLGLTHDDEYTNPHYRSGPPAKLWARRKVAALRRRKIVKEALARKGGQAPKDYASDFAKKYGSPKAALADACQALFNLNRYTRHDTCSDGNRREIHELKSALISFLYRAERYTDRVERLTRTLPEQQCNACDGLGCDRCDGTGVWREAREVSSYVFTFTVDGQRFTWMQPDFALTFVPRVEATRPDDGKPRELDTTLNIPRTKLAQAKALVRFALTATK
jgi:hypothetical protein